jgi:hypothetical protein
MCSARLRGAMLSHSLTVGMTMASSCRMAGLMGETSGGLRGQSSG